VFLNCDVAAQLWNTIAKWLDLPFPLFIDLVELKTWVDLVSLSKWKKKVVEVIVMTMVWMLWRYRNCVVFQNNSMKKSDIFDMIVVLSFDWFSNRNRKFRIDWPLWLHNPLIHIFM